MSLTNGHIATEETWDLHNRMMVEPLAITDLEMYSILKKEKHRQSHVLELSASVNFASRAVLEAMGSCMNNRYPTVREKNGEFERVCKTRALEAFGLDSDTWGVDLRPYSGSPANFSIYLAIVGPHGRIMGLDVPDGGHISHGYMRKDKKISATSLLFESMPYKVDPETGYIDYDKLEENARLFCPKLIIAGASAYSRNFDYPRMKQITDEIGAYLLADIAHISGLVAAGLVPSPFEFCDIVSTTTYKTLRGCRSGIIYYRKGVQRIEADGKKTLYKFEPLINQVMRSGLQGGQHSHSIAGVAVALKQTMTPQFKAYQKQVLANCKALSSALTARGYKIVTGGTDTHLIVVDLRNKETDGMHAAKVLEACAIMATKNSCPGDKNPLRPSGLRLGTPALTSRALVEEDFRKVAEFLDKGIELTVELQRSLDPNVTLEEFMKALSQDKFQQRVDELRVKVENFVKQFPMPGFSDI
ncbi:serine hydroxymethyltransferase, cytosolic-like isoform X1 [Thalassophryne amazonica]|uniref:serine hydroxymethyltransferase, cytosolic-like isoform X1 n=1 Tax=Thalassophryne amazonica TaxID=390379 RepID=UPI001472147B|nr:serine hydroxymethyltransferase, cytosolic-like isoform X1 [Thalassophryne amazonica]XP_034045986.1 serine hydroxymethyltransferase, cytosolic-like isoform X1 [Thalassophryne amazonica]